MDLMIHLLKNWDLLLIKEENLSQGKQDGANLFGKHLKTNISIFLVVNISKI